MIGYFEDEAVKSYSEYLILVETGVVENVKAPQIAIDYYNLNNDARLSDLIESVRLDEMKHSNVNHAYADTLMKKNKQDNISDKELNEIEI